MVNGHRAPAGQRSGWVARRWLSVALAAAAGPVLAQAPAARPAAPVTAAPQAVFTIKGFQVSGPNPLGQADTARVLAPFVRTGATIDTLQQATAALEKALRDKGYGLHKVALPPQEVGDTVRLEIVTFGIGRVSVENRSINDEQNIRASVPELREGGTPNFRTLAVQTAIANENPNKQIQVGLREGEEPDKIDATITVKEDKPWNLAVGASNSGSAATGRDRLTVAGSHSNVFNLDHQFTGAYTTSMEQPGDVRQLGLAYRAPLYRQGGVVGVSYTNSDVVGDFGAFRSTGAGHTFGANYTLYLPPQGPRRSYVVLGVDDKLFKAARINDFVVPGTFDRRSRPLTVGYYAKVESDASVWGYNLDLAMNTGSGSHNDLVSYQSEDPRVSTVHWKALRGGFSYLAPLAQTWLVGFRGNFQYSPDVLISGEQFGLGGTGSVRGTTIERPLSADKGVFASVELSTPELAPGLRGVGFLDAGWLGNNAANAGTKPHEDHLASAGVGLRYARGAFAFSAEYGRLLNSSKVPPTLNSAAPRSGDDKLYVNLSVRF